MDSDEYLLTVDANERSMVYKFALYLERALMDNDIFNGWHLDCEFNRKGDFEKKKLFLEPSEEKLRRARRKKQEPATADETSVFPDIIIHQRNTIYNLIVIEAKKSHIDDSFDEAKLTQFINDARYQYRFGAFLKFVIKGQKRGSNPDVLTEPFNPQSTPYAKPSKSRGYLKPRR